MDPFQRADTVGGHVDPAVELFLFRPARSEGFFQTSRHAGARFARSHDDDPSHLGQGDFLVADSQRRTFDVHCIAHELIGADGGETGMPDGQGVGENIG